MQDRIKPTLFLCQHVPGTSGSDRPVGPQGRWWIKLTILPLQQALLAQGMSGVHVPTGKSLMARSPERTGEMSLSGSPFPRAEHKKQRQSQCNNLGRNILAPEQPDNVQRVDSSYARQILLAALGGQRNKR